MTRSLPIPLSRRHKWIQSTRFWQGFDTILSCCILQFDTNLFVFLPFPSKSFTIPSLTFVKFLCHNHFIDSITKFVIAFFQSSPGISILTPIFPPRLNDDSHHRRSRGRPLRCRPVRHPKWWRLEPGDSLRCRIDERICRRGSVVEHDERQPVRGVTASTASAAASDRHPYQNIPVLNTHHDDDLVDVPVLSDQQLRPVTHPGQETGQQL